MARKLTVLNLDKSTTVTNKLKIRLDDMDTIQPLTENQRRFFEIYENSQIMLLHGVAGTGKSYIALYRALEEVLDKNNF